MTALATLPLYTIESELLELLALAEEPDLEPEAKQAIEKQLAEYFTAEVRKVDGIASAVHRCDSALAEIEDEIRRLKKMRDAWEARQERITGSALRAMQTFGVRVLQTPTNKLTVCANGGPQPLQVDDDHNLRDEFLDITVTMPLPTWFKLVEPARSAGEIADEYIRDLENRYPCYPNTDAVRDALKRGQKLLGARLLDRGTHLRVK